MRVLVMGAGALGGCYGAALAQHGHDVTFVARGEHLAALQARGLEIRHGEETIDRLAALLGPEHVLAGVSYIRAGRPAPGVLEFVSHLRPTIIGEQSGRLTPRVESIATALREAGIDVVVSDHPQRAIWEKFVGIVALGTITSACASPVGPIRETAEGLALLRTLLAEAIAVAQAAGVDLPAETLDQMLGIVAAMPPTNSTSLRDDFERGHRTELDLLTGALVRYGRDLGVPTLAFAALYAVLKVRALNSGNL